MGLSIFDLFKIGIGPSSSHTVGPMVAANRFVDTLQTRQLMPKVASVQIDLFGALAMTGSGHATDTAILLGLLAEQPDQLDPNNAPAFIESIDRTGQIDLGRVHTVPFSREHHLHFHFGQSLPAHPNGMTLTVKDKAGLILFSNTYYSVGGGFVLDEQEAAQESESNPSSAPTIPFPFESAHELLERCKEHNLTIAELVLANERHLARYADIDQEILRIWSVMEQCIERGCAREGELPGGLQVVRRAHGLHQQLLNRQENEKVALDSMDWVSVFALAVNEEKRCGWSCRDSSD